MAIRSGNHRKTQRFNGMRLEHLESRELMAADFMAPMTSETLPDSHLAETQAAPLDLDWGLEINPDIFDDIGPLFPVDDPFVGTWTNIDAGTGGITKIEITRDRSGHHIEAWGACVPEDCEWGKVDLDLLGTSILDNTPDYAIGHWDPGYKDATITLRLFEGGLTVDLYNVYKDDSGRADFHQRYSLTDSGDLIQYYVLADESFSDKIVGGWVNQDPHTGGLTKLKVSPTSTELNVEGWGSCVPNDCDWGSVPMHAVGTSISDTSPERSVANWDHGFETVFMTTHVSGSNLVTQRYTVFHDDSGRSNYYSQDVMWKIGDSNHDGYFNTWDMMQVLAAGEYEDGVTGNSTWEEGDWNRDGDFTTEDLIDALESGGYEATPIFQFEPVDPPFAIPAFDLPFDDKWKQAQAVDEVFLENPLADLLVPPMEPIGI